MSICKSARLISDAWDSFTSCIPEQIKTSQVFKTGDEAQSPLLNIGMTAQLIQDALAAAKSTLAAIHSGLETLLSYEWAENCFECFDVHAYYCVQQMSEADDDRDKELKRFDVVF